MTKNAHLHGCPTCHDTFVCACKDLTSDPRCIPCIGKTGDSMLAMGRRPGKCCPAHIRAPRKEEMTIYRLAGSQLWWICGECKRAFNFKPQEPMK